MPVALVENPFEARVGLGGNAELTWPSSLGVSSLEVDGLPALVDAEIRILDATGATVGFRPHAALPLGNHEITFRLTSPETGYVLPAILSLVEEESVLDLYAAGTFHAGGLGQISLMNSSSARPLTVELDLPSWVSVETSTVHLRERHHRTYVPALLASPVEPGNYAFSYTYSDGQESSTGTGNLYVSADGQELDETVDERRVRLSVEGNGAITGFSGNAAYPNEWGFFGFGLQHLPYVREHAVTEGYGFSINFVESENAVVSVTLDGSPCPLTGSGVRDYTNRFGEPVRFETRICHWSR